jgi:photosystem II stability/assembly factor-like uncharacterized protein
MKQIISFLFLISLITACNAPLDPPAAAPEETPSPYPENFAPAQIDAALVDAPQLTTISMLDESNGWGITETAVVRTNDGGVTWYDLTPTGLTDLGFAVSNFFLDPDHAWVLVAHQTDFQSGMLYRTEDGGLSWSSNPVPFGGGHLAFVDAFGGWMLADLGVGAGSQAVAVYQTYDGGRDWSGTFMNDPTIDGATDSLPLSGIKYGLIPRDMQTAWIGGVVYAPGTVYLFRTNDAGHTWSPVPLSLPEGVEETELGFEDLQFVSPDHAFLTMRMTGANYQLAVYATNDGGDTWTLTPTLISNGGSSDFVSAAQGFVWNGSQFYVTRDAAQTWTIVSPDIVFGDTLARMDFVNLQVGWVITYDTTGRYTLYKTTDGAATWTSLFP